jgi:hypothetical protein
MLIFRKHAVLLAAIAMLLGIISFSACKDDNPSPATRSKIYAIFNNRVDSILKGNVTLKENTDSSLDLTIALRDTSQNVKHPVYFILGTVTAPTTDTVLVDTLTVTGGMALVTKTVLNKVKSITVHGVTHQLRYNSVDTTLSMFTKVVYSAQKDSVLAVGNIFKNGTQIYKID